MSGQRATAANRPQPVEAVHIHVLDLVWAYLYQHTDHPPSQSLTDRFRRHIERLNTRKLEDEIARIAPDSIIYPHFLPAELLSRRIARGLPTPPVWVNITDMDVLGLRLHPHSPQMMLRPDCPPSRREAAEVMNLNPDKTTVLMMSGGAGVGSIDTLVAQAAELPGDIQIIALAGRNETLLKRLHELAVRYPGRIHLQGLRFQL